MPTSPAAFQSQCRLRAIVNLEAVEHNDYREYAADAIGQKSDDDKAGGRSAFFRKTRTL